MDKVDKSPLVSIIVPVYKVEKYLRTCLDSILAQTYTNWEAILVDDGSPDNCPQIIDEYATRDARMRTVHRENGGQSAARNSGLRTVRGDFVTFLDSDDFLHRDYLKNMVELAVAHNADIVQCDFTRGAETEFPVIDEAIRIAEYDNHSIFTSFAAKVIVWSKIYKKHILDGLEFPEGRVNEDDCTNWRMYYKARRIVVSSQKLYYYTVNPTSTMGRLGKYPDLRFIDAYHERIAFFENEGTEDLTAVSRVQLLKSLSLTLGNPNLTEADFKRVNDERHLQYIRLKESSLQIPLTLKIVFALVDMAPRPFSKIARKLHSGRRQ